MTNIVSRLKDAPLPAQISAGIITLFVLVALLAPYVAPYGEFEVVSARAYEPWSAEFLLGTDHLGRDFFSRLLFGAKNSIGIAFITVVLAFALGTLLGILAATVRGLFDQIMSRLVDALMSIPELIFTLMLLAFLGPSVFNLIVIIGILDATRFYRLARAAAFNLVELDFIEAAKARGEGLSWIILREIMPNMAVVLTSEFGMRFCFVLLAIASLSFLGVGLPPPMAEWGAMVKENSDLISYGDITPLIPAIAIAMLTISVNFVADWILSQRSGQAIRRERSASDVVAQN